MASAAISTFSATQGTGRVPAFRVTVFQGTGFTFGDIAITSGSSAAGFPMGKPFLIAPNAFITSSTVFYSITAAREGIFAVITKGLQISY